MDGSDVQVSDHKYLYEYIFQDLALFNIKYTFICSILSNCNEINEINSLPSLVVDNRYAVSRVKPWGVYISTADALNESLRPEDIFRENPERY